MLKYPWKRDFAVDGKRYKKFACYDTEEPIFDQVRTGYPTDYRSAEAEIMDWADEIAYAVHDLYDFARAGLIPLDQLSQSKHEFEIFLGALQQRWAAAGIKKEHTIESMRKVFAVLALAPSEHYNGGQRHRAALRTYTSILIGQYVQALQLCDPQKHPDGKCVNVTPQAKVELDVLKECTWVYVIEGAGMAGIQYGQRQIVTTLFDILYRDAKDQRRLTPVWAKELLDAGQPATRVATDIVSGLVEDQALTLYQRLTGYSPGSLVNPILR